MLAILDPNVFEGYLKDLMCRTVSCSYCTELRLPPQPLLCNNSFLSPAAYLSVLLGGPFRGDKKVLDSQ